MTAPGTPASPAPGAPTSSGGQVNPPVPAPPQPAPPQPAPQQAAPQLPAAKQPAALPAAAAPAGLPVPAAQASPPVPVVQTAAAAPASPPPTRTTKKSKATSGGGGGGYLVAVFALIIAVIAAGAAAYSLKLSMELRDENAAAPLAEATPAPDESVAQEPEPTETPTPTATTPTATTPAGPQYDPQLVRLEVRVPNPTGCAAAYVDVDTANVGVENGHEFYLSRCQNPSALQVHIDRTSGRSTSDDDPGAEECAALVAGTPTTELVLRAETGLTFCLLTNRTQANAANLPQRLAIVEVLSVTTSEVRLALSTFSIED